MGMKRAKRKRERDVSKCRRQLCEYIGTTNCPELQNHTSFVCKQCQLSFKRCDDLKFHKEKIHEGLVFNCEICEYSNARKGNLKKHIIFKHSDGDLKQRRKQRRKPSVCKEEGCTLGCFRKTLFSKKKKGYPPTYPSGVYITQIQKLFLIG